MKKKVVSILHIYYIYYYKLKSYFIKLISIKELLFYKLDKKKYLNNYFFFVFFLIVKKKLNSVYFYRQTYILGISKIMKSLKKSRKIFFRHINSYCSFFFDKRMRMPIFIKIRLSNKNIKKLNFDKNLILKKYPIMLKKLKMSQCFYIFFKRRCKKISKKSKLINKKYLFVIKKMIRKYGYLNNFHFNIIGNNILRKRKVMLYYIMFKFFNYFSLNFDDYTAILYILNTKTLTFLFKSESKFFCYYFRKYFATISGYYNEYLSRYSIYSYKNNFYNQRFIKYKYVTKKYAIGFIKKQLPNEDVMLNYNFKIIIFVIYNKYFKNWIKFKYMLFFKTLKNFFYKAVISLFKGFFYLIFHLFRNIALSFNKSSFFFFSEFLVKISRFFLFFKFSLRILRRASWHFHGIYQLETLYLYLGSSFFDEFDFFDGCLSKCLYNIFYKIYYIENYKKLSLFYCRTNIHFKISKFNLWFLKKKLKSSYFKVNFNEIYYYFKIKFRFFNFLFVDNHFFFYFVKKRLNCLKISLFLKKFWIKSYDMNFRFELYPFYRKIYYLYGFLHIYPYHKNRLNFYKNIVHYGSFKKYYESKKILYKKKQIIIMNKKK